MEYIDQLTNERYLPYVVETSAGCDRLFLALLADAYTEDTVDGEERVVLRLSSKVAPVKAAVLPLMKKGGMSEAATKLRDELSTDFLVQYDDAGSIGKRYRRQDEIGTPFCITVDHQSLEENTVTVRYRDTAVQERIDISRVREFLGAKLV
jgi:glycyl-tRNA synthetase